MKAVIQRVSSASVAIDNLTVGIIGVGFLVLLGIGEDDEVEDVQWLAKKIVGLRVFSDENGLMNADIENINGGILVISQFTLFAQTKKGNRPSFIKAARPEKAIPLYEKFVAELETLTSKKVETGRFGADMQVSLVNDGPVTIIIDTKNKE